MDIRGICSHVNVKMILNCTLEYPTSVEIRQCIMFLPFFTSRLCFMHILPQRHSFEQTWFIQDWKIPSESCRALYLEKSVFDLISRIRLVYEIRKKHFWMRGIVSIWKETLIYPPYIDFSKFIWAIQGNIYPHSYKLKKDRPLHSHNQYACWGWKFHFWAHLCILHGGLICVAFFL